MYHQTVIYTNREYESGLGPMLTMTQRFIVRVRNNSPQFGVVYHLWIDGKRMECMCVQDNEPHDMLGTAVGESQRRPYLFSNITTTGKHSATLQSL